MSRLARVTLFSAALALGLSFVFVITLMAYPELPFAIGLALYLTEGVLVWTFLISSALLILRTVFRGTRRLVRKPSAGI